MVPTRKVAGLGLVMTLPELTAIEFEMPVIAAVTVSVAVMVRGPLVTSVAENVRVPLSAARKV